MFRQIVAHRWAPDLTPEDRATFEAAAAGLGSIPDVYAARGGSDLKLFPGNHDFALVLDFGDREAAARYVQHPIHQTFIAEYRRMIDDRVIVQCEWGQGEIVGVHHLKLPVTDVARSRTWYVEALGFAPDLEFVEDGVLTGAVVRHPVAGLRLALRGDPDRARAMAGFDPICLAVSSNHDLDHVIAGLDAGQVPHSGRRRGREGWAVEVHDPDGIAIRIYSLERHEV
ncbi:MAG: hypothetical protein NVSMB29_04260 [Candidatus Dormibacteria bacterium]